MKCENEVDDINIYKQIDHFVVSDKSSYTQLRGKLRIVPKLVGLPDVGSNLVQANSQDSENLPAVLMHEQARYVCKRGLAKCYAMPDALEMLSLLEQLPEDDDRRASGVQESKKTTISGNKRKSDLSGMTLDEIVEKLKRDHDRKREKIQSSCSKASEYCKKRNNSISSMSHEDFVKIAEKIMKEQQKHVPPPVLSNRLAPKKEVTGRLPKYEFGSLTDERLLCRYLTFCDLHERGFYLTSACKFGGDFLVYHGDPLQYHASFVAVCNAEQSININVLLAQIRVSHNVNKHLLLCQYMKGDHNCQDCTCPRTMTCYHEQEEPKNGSGEIKPHCLLKEDGKENTKNFIEYTLLDYVKANKP